QFSRFSAPSGQRCRLWLCERRRQFRRGTDRRMSRLQSDVRRKAVVEALSWVGTPYRHQASTKGLGCDCLGLVRGVWRALYGEEPETPGPYAPDWAEAGGTDRLLDAARRHCREIAPADM